MGRDGDRFVLDEMGSPGGRLQLIAFRERHDPDRRRGWNGPPPGGHARARDLDPLRAHAWRDRGWAVAFGGVPPGAVRAEIRNDDGEVFPAKILPLPAELATEDRAAWGLIDRWEDECLLVCFDEEDRYVTTVGDFAVRPGTLIGEGDDPIGGGWKLWISHPQFGPMLNIRSAWGRSGGGIGKLPAAGFGSSGRGHQVLPTSERWEVDGLVSSEAERVEVTTAVGTKWAVVLPVPSASSARVRPTCTQPSADQLQGSGPPASCTVPSIATNSQE